MLKRTMVTGTAVAGTLDIASAVLLTLVNGKSPGRMLAGLASGALGEWTFDHPVLGATIGLLVHFAIMSVIVAVFVIAARRIHTLTARPVVAGIGYGLLVCAFMYWVVIPLRWPPTTWPPSLRSMAMPVAIHILLVGLPIALITAAALRREKR